MTYLDALKSAIDYWNIGPIQDEWYFEKFRKEYIENMSQAEAFSSVDDTVPFLIEETDESTACEILQTLLNLSKRAETTQLPERLSAEMDHIDNKFEGFGEYARSKLLELKGYYRLS